MEKFAVQETGTKGLADAGDGRQLLTVLPVQLHQIQVVVGKGGVTQKRRQDIDIFLGKRGVRSPAGEGEDPEDIMDTPERHTEKGLGCVMGAVHPSEAAVLLDIVDEKRGFVDHRKLGDARCKIHSFSRLDTLAEAECGLDHEGLPFLSLQDQDGTDIGVGQFQGALQGNLKQVVAVECDIAEIGKFFQRGEL